jgi:hypothetical protein
MTTTVTRPAPAAPPGWVIRGRMFFSTFDGRFDVMFSEAVNAWIVLDNLPPVGPGVPELRPAKKVRFATLAKAVAWCSKHSGGRSK